MLSDVLSIQFQEVLPLTVVERQRIRAMLAEKQLSLAGLTYRSRALETGRLIGAHYIVVGSLLHVNGSLRLDLQILDVAPAL